mgnify:FL=1
MDRDREATADLAAEKGAVEKGVAKRDAVEKNVGPAAPADARPPKVAPSFARAENEDDDGYDPWSDRRPTPEPLFERDPWA